MNNPKIHHLILLLIITIPPTKPTQTVHKLLQSQGLPSGLLPKEIKSFEYNTSNGVLQVYLDAPCLAKFENRVYFESVIRANLSYGSLLGVHGLSQEELFIWFPVKEIAVSDPLSGIILFDIGMVHKQFSLSIFEDPPTCKNDQVCGDIGVIWTGRNKMSSFFMLVRSGENGMYATLPLLKKGL